MATITSNDLVRIGNDAFKLMNNADQRGLRNVRAWAAELYHALCQVKGLSEQFAPHFDQLNPNSVGLEYAKYTMAKFYFQNQEYDRAAYFTEKCTTMLPKFLHYYSVYCAGEKKRLDDIADSTASAKKAKNHALKSLRVNLEKAFIQGSLDGYCLYIYGLVLKKLQGLEKVAIKILCKSIYAEPLNWGAWLELSTLIVDRESLDALVLPNHWIKDFFLAKVYYELQLNKMSLDIYTHLMEIGFSKSTYVISQVALVQQNLRQLEKSIEYFQQLLKMDPFRLDHMDIYSNMLYVREMRVELSHLAHNTFEIDKYRVETCCVIGNFYSLRKQHEKAVLFFQRTLKLNPNYLSAYTLMGHEYMEMKNTSAAIQCYRQAVEANRRDFRAWYGLGQTYEILKMSFYSLYYYKQAHFLMPHDSRMIMALGESYERLGKLEEAKKCYWRAHAVGDIEGMALVKLAKMYSQLNEEDLAASAYNDYIRNAQASNDRDELCHAYLFLAKYYYKRLDLEKAYENAQQCMEFPETKEEAKSILHQIATQRAQHDETFHAIHIRDTPRAFSSPMIYALTP